MALVISTWQWGTKYGQQYVDRLRAGVARNMRGQYTFRVFKPEKQDEHLTKMPGCFPRLRMFSPVWQEEQGLKPGDKLVCLDLDMVVTGPLDPLWQSEKSFLILQGANAMNPCPFNGSVMQLRCGEHREVWEDFSLEVAKTTRHHEFPDDQGWLWHMLPNACGWKVGPTSGIYAFHKKGWPPGDNLPQGARLVAFFGWRDPEGFWRRVPWVREHWLC